MFILLDNSDKDVDQKLAQHITTLHQGVMESMTKKEFYQEKELKEFIAEAKKYNPTIKKYLHSFIVD